MIVCHCRVVSDREVRDAIAAGATGLCAIAEACQVATRCGGCLPEIRRLLDERGLPVEADLTSRDLRQRLAQEQGPLVEVAV
jgi:bacterioferritin-associated ferredoxin